MIGDSRFQRAVELIDEENARDPNFEKVDGVPIPKELLYSKRLTEIVEEICSNPSEELLIAIRAQHICRWTIPRTAYAMNRRGYLQWREKLKKFHSEKVADILAKVGYDSRFIERVKLFVTKKNFPDDPQSRVLEDAVTLYFLKYQFADFISQKGEEKAREVLKKAWVKLSPEGQKHALSVELGKKEKVLIREVIG